MKKSILFCLLIVMGLSVMFSASAFAQTKKKKPANRKNPIIKPLGAFKISSEDISVSSVEVSERPKYLTLEPCGKETSEQVAEVENAKDVSQQVEILTNRLLDKDEWTRGCSIYRLGEFKKLSSPTLPLIIKLLRDDDTDGIFYLASDAIYKIPPDHTLKDWLRMAKETDVYTRIYGLWALGYFSQTPGTFQLEDSVNMLIEATRDEDRTVRWIALRSITRMGVNAKEAVPALIEVIQKNTVNPLQAIYALGNMGPHRIPAAPVLFDILYHPEKYAKENGRRSALYSVTAISLGRLGKDLIPLLEKEFDKEPIAILQVTQNISDGDIGPIIVKGFKHSDKEVRKKTIGLIGTISVQLLPSLIELLNDVDPEVRKEAAGRLGSLAENKRTPTEVTAQLREKALPALIKTLRDKDNDVVCQSAYAIGDFGTDAELAIPALVRMSRQKDVFPNYCAERALYLIGPKGRKFLSAAKFRELDEMEKSLKDISLDTMFDKKVKPITPKVGPKTQKIPDSY